MDRFEFDDDYLRRLRERDSQTVEHFVGYVQPLLLIKTRKRLKSHADVEDAIQDVFTRVFRLLDTVRDGHKLGGWVNSICENVIHEKLRNPGRVTQLSDQINDLPIVINFVKKLEDAETVATVRQVMDELKTDHPKDELLLREFFLEERDRDEICRDHGVDRGYFRVQLHRALKRFEELYRRKVN